MLISGTNKIVAVHVILGIQLVLFLGIVYFFFKIAKLLSLRFWIVGLPLFAGYFLTTGLYGSEAFLNALMLTISLYY